MNVWYSLLTWLASQSVLFYKFKNFVEPTLDVLLYEVDYKSWFDVSWYFVNFHIVHRISLGCQQSTISLGLKEILLTLSELLTAPPLIYIELCNAQVKWNRGNFQRVVGIGGIIPLTVFYLSLFLFFRYLILLVWGVLLKHSGSTKKKLCSRGLFFWLVFYYSKSPRRSVKWSVLAPRYCPIASSSSLLLTRRLTLQDGVLDWEKVHIISYANAITYYVYWALLISYCFQLW